MVFSKVGDKVGLVDRVAVELQNLILSGTLKAGTLLPPERELSEELGVSRTVLREAVRILVAKGLLATRHGVGTFVQQMTVAQVSELLRLLAQMADGGVSWRDLHQVRAILESEVAGLAAAHATDADITNLAKLIADMDAHASDVDAFAEADADFHLTLARMTHNPILSLFVSILRDLLRDYMRQVLQANGSPGHVVPYHVKIFEAVRARNEDEARQAMREHLAHTRRNTEAFLGQQQRQDDLVGATESPLANEQRPHA